MNNRALDLEQIGDFRISRFVRDPRDLVVSGYFYHRRGAEPWTNLRSPSEEDWYFANGVVPEGMRGTDLSFSEYLQSLPVDEGLLAELEFRRSHFQSMTEWPKEHRNIILYRYEDILGNETRVWRELFEFYGMPPLERLIGRWFARRYAAARLTSHPHMRNPASGQWRKHFTPRIRRRFDAEYAGLIRELGYPAD